MPASVFLVQIKTTTAPLGQGHIAGNLSARHNAPKAVTGSTWPVLGFCHFEAVLKLIIEIKDEWINSIHTKKGGCLCSHNI